MTRESYLAAFDQYFDCVAGAVMEQGGEVFKFIGDAVLAIFPIGEPDGLSKACSQAHSALRQAFQHMVYANKVRIANGEQALAFGTGLHRGNIT
ncbi:MAG: hypothetical protein P8J55_02055 [Pseudomonadales bacterium]|nr:hypothetical protein [Pseudomonadales bacterium]